MEDINKSNSSNRSAEELKLLTGLMEKRGILKIERETTIPRRGKTRATLSFAQQRLWFINQFDHADTLRYILFLDFIMAF